MTHLERFTQEQGIFIPRSRPQHRADEYDEQGFEVLMHMQREHFWYRGRHKLLLNILRKELAKSPGAANPLRAIDLGGGCGGWLEYLHARDPDRFQELALADSSLRALAMAEPVVGDFAARYQVDLLDLPWREEWDVVFLLDVLEHIPEQEEVLRQIRASLRPGGLLFVTTPALKIFWSYNDDLVHHQRRYSRHDYRALAESTGLELVRSEYFMFFLSPALFLSRLLFRPPVSATPEERVEHLARTHRTPAAPLNTLLEKVFSMEAALIGGVHFPWGTSILSVFRR